MFENGVLREIFVAERNWETVDCIEGSFMKSTAH
jgi:hypothetical protein